MTLEIEVYAIYIGLAERYFRKKWVNTGYFGL